MTDPSIFTKPACRSHQDAESASQPPINKKRRIEVEEVELNAQGNKIKADGEVIDVDDPPCLEEVLDDKDPEDDLVECQSSCHNAQ